MKSRGGWIEQLATCLCLSGLSIVLLTLWRIGPPPGLRIDVLWVHGHRALVEVLLVGLAAALLATGAALLIGRGRAAIGLLWILAAGLAVTRFPDQLAIICQVLLERAIGSAPG